MYFLPKRCMNINKKEIARAIRFTGKKAQYITFRLPRKAESF
jgi:hypothetical protein